MRRLLSALAALLFAGSAALADGFSFPPPGARAQGTSAAPTGTSSTASPVMAGLAVAFTPASTAKMQFIVPGNMVNSTSGDGCVAQIAYGTGGAPANGAAFTGTTAGSATIGQSTAVSAQVPFALAAYATGLTLGTAYWLDLQQKALTGGTCSLQNITVNVIEQ